MAKIGIVTFLLFANTFLMAQNAVNSSSEIVSNAVVASDTILPRPSEKYSKLLLEASKSDCFCSKKMFFTAIVDIDGSLSDVVPLRQSNYCFEEILIKYIKKSSPWTAASTNGQAIKMKVTFPIDFRDEEINNLPRKRS